jgi:hypothetical protein
VVKFSQKKEVVQGDRNRQGPFEVEGGLITLFVNKKSGLYKPLFYCLLDGNPTRCSPRSGSRLFRVGITGRNGQAPSLAGHQ